LVNGRIPSAVIEKSGFLGYLWVDVQNSILVVQNCTKKVQNTVKVWYYYSKVAVLVIRTFAETPLLIAFICRNYSVHLLHNINDYEN
jgi:hypothetical protein